ncbi:MAG: hypothetical protein AAFX44_14350 [Pseudomonadota bacterium]
MATFKALNDTFYPAALGGLLIIAFTASHTKAPAEEALSGPTPFGAEGIEYVIHTADYEPAAKTVVDLGDAAEPAPAPTPTSTVVSFEVVVDELAEQAGEQAVKILLTTSEAQTSL